MSKGRYFLISPAPSANEPQSSSNMRLLYCEAETETKEQALLYFHSRCSIQEHLQSVIVGSTRAYQNTPTVYPKHGWTALNYFTSKLSFLRLIS